MKHSRMFSAIVTIWLIAVMAYGPYFIGMQILRNIRHDIRHETLFDQIGFILVQWFFGFFIFISIFIVIILVVNIFLFIRRGIKRNLGL